VPHLLIVDDDEDILSLLTKFFRKQSQTVMVVTGGAAMFTALEQHSIDHRGRQWLSRAWKRLEVDYEFLMCGLREDRNNV